MVTLLGFIFLLAPLASCGTPAPLQFTSLNLGIPAEALKSPVSGPLADNTRLHVRFTFKIDPNLLKQADQQRVQPGQSSRLQDFAKKIGIDDGTYQKIKDFFLKNFSVVNVDGSPQQALGESTLDIQMVAGLARSINIRMYQTDASDNTNDVWVNVNDELQQLIDDNVNNTSAGNVVSISLGAAEGEMTQQDMQALDSSFQQLSRVLHMSVLVASGDCGAFTSQRYGDLSVSFPASDPWVIAVGGTILNPSNTGGRANEVVWSDNSNRSRCKNQWGSGGGNSAIFKRPGWQNASGVNNRYSQGARQLPDVSAAAYALAVYFQGRWGAVGGTSAAAPIWGAGLALVNQGLLQQTHQLANVATTAQQFYAVASRSGGLHPYYDVTSGNNLYYPAVPGWDFATGLGTPDLPDFYQVMLNNFK